jgi:hypothetical protein
MATGRSLFCNVIVTHTHTQSHADNHTHTHKTTTQPHMHVYKGAPDDLHLRSTEHSVVQIQSESLFCL